MLGVVIQQAAEDVKEASALVRELTEDVKKGIATKADLAKAIADLEAKAKTASSLTAATEKSLRGLNSFGDAKSKTSLGLGAALGIIAGIAIISAVVSKVL
jgi:hypothetical protein